MEKYLSQNVSNCETLLKPKSFWFLPGFQKMIWVLKRRTTRDSLVARSVVDYWTIFSVSRFCCWQSKEDAYKAKRVQLQLAFHPDAVTAQKPPGVKAMYSTGYIKATARLTGNDVVEIYCMQSFYQTTVLLLSFLPFCLNKFTPRNYHSHTEFLQIVWVFFNILNSKFYGEQLSPI